MDVGAGIAFFVGAVSFIEFRVGGRLFATDIALALVLSLQLIKQARRLERPFIGKFLFLGSLWLASQVLTDMIRHSLPEDYLRGWAKIVFFLIDVSALYLLVRNNKRLLFYGAGLAAGQLLSFALHPTFEAAEDPWKWGLAWPVTISLVIGAAISFDHRKKALSTTLLAGAAALNFYFNYRSLGFICFETFALACLIRYRPERQSKRRLMYAVCGMLLGGFVFQSCYKYAAGAGLLGRAALEKYQQQSEGDLGLLLGGRSESLASLQAITESPLIGHGSWARDSRYVALLQQTLTIHGYGHSHSVDDLIPTHSHVLGAWVEAGILGAVFWSYILYLAVKGMYQGLTKPGGSRLLTFYCALMLAWDIPFSPFGAQQRFLSALYILVIIRCVSIAPLRRRRVVGVVELQDVTYKHALVKDDGLISA